MKQLQQLCYDLGIEFSRDYDAYNRISTFCFYEVKTGRRFVEVYTHLEMVPYTFAEFEEMLTEKVCKHFNLCGIEGVG